MTLERINPSHIPSLFRGLDLPKNNDMFDMITGFPYIYSEDDLFNHISRTLREHADLTIFAIKACEDHLGPPTPPTPGARTSVLGINGYRLNESSRTIRLDDLVYSPALQRTYAATEAHYLLLRHMFEAQKIAPSRVWVTSNALNIKSRRHTERMGYKYEGTLRKDNVTRWGTSRDTDCLSMLDDEWPWNKRVLERWLLPANFDDDGKRIRSLEEERALLRESAL